MEVEETLNDSTDDQNIHNAIALLSNPEVQSTPLEKQIVFLNSKGMTSEAIQKAYQLSGNPISLEQIESIKQKIGKPNQQNHLNHELPNSTFNQVSNGSNIFREVFEISKLAGYAMLTARLLWSLSPITISIGDPPKPIGAMQVNELAAPPVGNWYDEHKNAAEPAPTNNENTKENEKDVPQSATTEPQSPILQEEVEELRKDNAAMRSELAALKGQIRSLQRKLEASSRPTGRSAEDLLKPLPPKSPDSTTSSVFSINSPLFPTTNTGLESLDSIQTSTSPEQKSLPTETPENQKDDNKQSENNPT
eukprot:NODE_5453_length_1013_cov_28.322472_g4884_i0.p1 GENE.NODE_5453_length_1013_cov_28.322472_g4884_i0~~NODE_5453_length_1013_cov_28.322472_g4884_i0.p1  ORF type:complete len:326 (+),score=100.07 NODE_5453_length_1013_cov_28.322472_g4884_i0:58-978(+)